MKEMLEQEIARLERKYGGAPTEQEYWGLGNEDDTYYLGVDVGAYQMAKALLKTVEGK